jgi:hypothetical protein
MLEKQVQAILGLDGLMITFCYDSVYVDIQEGIVSFSKFLVALFVVIFLCIFIPRSIVLDIVGGGFFF